MFWNDHVLSIYLFQPVLRFSLMPDKLIDLLSQEELAEKIGISVTHMSHIETGNTKLSLPVFVELSRALEVRTDELLSDNNPGIRVASMEANARDLVNVCPVFL